MDPEQRARLEARLAELERRLEEAHDGNAPHRPVLAEMVAAGGGDSGAAKEPLSEARRKPNLIRSN